MASNPKIFGRTLRLSWQELTIGLAAILLGLVLLLLPRLATAVVPCVVGAIGIVFGIVRVVRYFTREARLTILSNDFTLGVGGIVIGILIIIFKDLLISLLPAFFGLVILMGGVFKVQTTLSLRRMNARRWYLELAAAILSAVLGAVILLNPFSTALLLTRIIGVALLIEGIQDLISVYAFKKTCDKFYVVVEESPNSEGHGKPL